MYVYTHEVKAVELSSFIYFVSYQVSPIPTPMFLTYI